jgi:hypothetical protein
VKKSCIYRLYVPTLGSDTPINDINPKAAIEYNAADSTIISSTVRGWLLMPAMWETLRIRPEMISVDRTVVATEREYVVVSIEKYTLSGKKVGETSIPNIVIPTADERD